MHGRSHDDIMLSGIRPFTVPSLINGKQHVVEWTIRVLATCVAFVMLVGPKVIYMASGAIQ